jgi:opacity protein-like surface antigen
MRYSPPAVIIAALAAVVISNPAAAQAPAQRVTLSITPAAATTGGDTEFSVAGTAGYRFTDHLSFEVELTWIDGAAGGDRDRVFALGGPELTTRGVNDILSRTTARFGGFDLRGLPNIPNIPIPVEGFTASADGRTLIGTLGLRYEPTVQTARFRPYLSGGLGMNDTGQELMVSIGTASRDVSQSMSHSGFALGAGGGASLRLFRSVWANADAKYFRLSRDRNVIRFGGGLGVRF